MKPTRRSFLQTCGAVAAAALTTPSFAFAAPGPASPRRYHLSTSCKILEADPGLLEAVAQAGVTDLWLTGYWAGNWEGPPEKIQQWGNRLKDRGLAAHVINVPLGHPDCGTPFSPVTFVDGSLHKGTSIHAPAVEKNCEAVRQLQAIGIDCTFLDDDFRLAASPGGIGGCFCAEHQREFLQKAGFRDAQWGELLDAVRTRRLTPILRAWVEYNCDLLTACFRAQQKAAPGMQLGIMAMYLGSEKAGIRLGEYRDVPFRVGEFMFSDGMFQPVKGKTDELFSSLFHRRFVRPELAYSETTAYPDRALSLKNKLAKLAVSTISDVRNTMFMCDFPREHWGPLAPAMKHHAEVHRVVAGHALRGPLKHFWGEASRYVGNDVPNSLCMALGIPFEVTDQPASDGFTFLSDADAQAAGSLPSAGTMFLGRPQASLPSQVQPMAESLPELLGWKQKVLPQLGKIPYVEGEAPVVCAWYPTARAVVLWNVGEQRQEFRLRYGDTQRTIAVDGLDVALVEGVAV